MTASSRLVWKITEEYQMALSALENSRSDDDMTLLFSSSLPKPKLVPNM
jgi:hypothetical protein